MPRDVVLLVIGLLMTTALSELTEVSPWLARRIVRRAARLWTNDRLLQRTYAEEWLAVIEERPGNLFKLASALALFDSARSQGIGGRFQQEPLCC